MRNRIRILRILLCVFFVSHCFSAYSQTVTVVTEEYPPYNYTEDGIIKGYSTEIVKEVLKRAGISYSLASYPWARTYKMALSSPNVLIYSIGRSEKREKLFKWIDVVAPYDIYLYKLKKRTDISVNNLNDAKRYHLGAVRDDVRAQYLEKHGFEPGKNLDLVAMDGQNIRKIMIDRIDLFPIDQLGLTYLLQVEGQKATDFEKSLYLKDLSAGLFLAFSLKTDDSLVEKCRAALAEIKKNGTYDAIMDKYIE